MTSTDTSTDTLVPDPERDLLLERYIAVAPALVWAAWTEPERVTQWFTPAPWTTPECEIDLRPGGIFKTVMESPEGERNDNAGCYLEVVEGTRLVWTTTMGAGYRPNEQHPMSFTAVITITPEGDGTRYSALVMHGNAADARSHAELGFHDGWGAALDQLVALWGH